jgi:outer membrane protein assembly factor BamB
MHCRIRGLLSLLALAALLAGGRPAAADNWPRFRGPNGTGIAHDKYVPVKWEAANVLWKIALPGRGNSSPVVWGKHLFVQSATKTERLLLCVDVTEGKILWSRAAPGGVGKTHAKNTLASSTPATDGERVYTTFWDGNALTLATYDFKGDRLWERNLGTFTSQHGAGASPVVWQDRVFFANDQDGSAEILALDARSGKTLWQAPRKAFRACYSSPFLLERKDRGPELIVASTAGLSGYDPRTGAENWVWNWAFDKMALRTTGSPIFGNGLIFASSGDGAGPRHMVAVKPGDQGDVSASNLVWQNKKAFPYVPCMLNWGEHVYFVNDKGMAGCAEAATGKLVWTKYLEADITLTASPVLIDGKVYACTEDGDVFVFAAAPKFELLARNSVGEPVRSTPAVADNRLYLRGQTHLFCIGKATR